MSDVRAVPDAGPAIRLALLLTSTLTVMAGATIAPSLPALREHFSDYPNVEYLARFVLTLPAFFVATCSPLAGYIVDRFGRRRLLIAGVALYGVAGASGAIFDSLPAILLSRALLGIAVAGVMTAATTLIGDYYAGLARTKMMAWRTTAVNGGGVVFMSLGGVLASLNWRGPFFVYLLALLLLPLIIRYLKEPPRALTAQALNAAGAPIAPAPVPWLLISMLYLLTFLYSWIFYVIPVQLPFYLRDIGLADPGVAGMAMAVVLLSSAVVSLVYAWIQTNISLPMRYFLGFGLMAIGYGLVGLYADLAAVFLGMVVTGTGMGIVMPALAVSLMDAAPAHLRGRVMGGNSTATFVGHFTSPLFSQPIVAAFGLGAAFQVSAALLLVVAAVATAVILRRARSARLSAAG